MFTKLITSSSRLFLPLLALGWMVALFTGFSVLERESFTPVAPTPVASAFPPHSKLSLNSQHPSLFLFLHPYCPCSRASVHELDTLLATVDDKASVTVVFVIPEGLPAGWETSDLWTAAAKLPNVAIFADQGGIEARRFQVNGSGHTLLYSPAGHLLFSGGITDSRGHEGENAGSQAIEDFILKGHASIAKSPVFGCSLL